MKGKNMLESVLFSGVIGFLWGLAISLLSNFLTWKTLQRPKGVMSTLIFVIRWVLLILAMALVYKNLAMLIGTALGLLTIKNMILVKNLHTSIQARKG